MYLSATFLLSLASLAAAAPASTVAAGSRKNVYLATCTARDCLLGILCDTSSSAAAAADTLSTVIYYNRPATAGLSPTDVATVSSPARSWEGATRKVTLRTAGDFTGTIDKGAASLAQSQIAGNATLGTEEFVCFRDGQATFQFQEGLLVEKGMNCNADYWCASISV